MRLTGWKVACHNRVIRSLWAPGWTQTQNVPCSEPGQQPARLHQECCQQVRGGDPSPLLCPVRHSQALCPLLGSSARQACRHWRAFGKGDLGVGTIFHTRQGSKNGDCSAWRREASKASYQWHTWQEGVKFLVVSSGPEEMATKI